MHAFFKVCADNQLHFNAAVCRQMPIRVQFLNVPDDIYRAQVDAMFIDSGSVWVGAIAGSLATACTALESGTRPFSLIAIALAIVGAMRCCLIEAYKKADRPALALSQVRKWEIAYVVGSSAYLLILGLLCVLSFSSLGDTFSRVSSLGGVAFILMGLPGRNFASNMLVNALLPIAVGCLFSAFSLAGGFYWGFGVFAVLPALFTLRRISIRLRGVYLDALLKARDMSVLADRFDTALNNMPYGLAMLDMHGRVLVTNQRLSEVFEISTVESATLDTLMRSAEKSGLIDEQELASLLSQLRLVLTREAREEMRVQDNKGRTLSLVVQPMKAGGAVLMVEDITEKTTIQARINELARYDPLTGLPNRTEFHERADRSIRALQHGSWCAVMFIDLDQFKQVNDTLGHAAGDKLLRAVAERLSTCFTELDVIARFGGDEFVVLLTSVMNREDAADAAKRVISALSLPFQIGDSQLGIGGSVGVALGSSSSADIDELLRNADLALYQAKADGRNTHRFFDIELEIKAQSRRNLEHDLRLAVTRNEFELYFQPIFDVSTQAFSGCEALLRWNHPTRGRVSPAVFVPVAEEIGLVIELDNWVLTNACRACSAWPLDVAVAVNISAVHFRDRRLVEAVKEALLHAKLAPNRLEIEVTESVVLENLQIARTVLSELRELGVRISLDDFGTGYSSLNYLNMLPFTKLKIDRTFLQGAILDSRPLRIIRGITALSTDLGLRVVMEGVETEAEYDLITGHTGVDEIQGFYFSRPVPEAEISMLFAQRRLSAA